MSQTFTVTIIDNNVIDGNQTVNLTLSSPSLSSTLLNPNSATLTIIDNDGSLILPAGAALTSESGPVNGAIDPNETVTMLFALRNAAGTNTANLVATLLATNGVSSPSGAMNYGVLVTNGPSVSRSFSFTAMARLIWVSPPLISRWDTPATSSPALPGLPSMTPLLPTHTPLRST